MTSQPIDNMEQYSWALVARSILQEYLATSQIKDALKSELPRKEAMLVERVEPESFAEQWIKQHVIGADIRFKEGVVYAFSQMLYVFANSEE